MNRAPDRVETATVIGGADDRTHPWAARPEAPCSWGDLLDRLTILELKCRRITEPVARAHVHRERDALAKALGDQARFPTALGPLVEALAAVNAVLWEIEDRIRAQERAGDFGPTFVTLARSVYRENDRRAAVKRRINHLLGSDFMEEKLYTTGPVAAR